MSLNLVPAKRSAARFLIEYFEPRICDSDGVSDCVRCNTLALARWMLQDIERSAPKTAEFHDWLEFDRAPAAQCRRCKAVTWENPPPAGPCSAVETTRLPKCAHPVLIDSQEQTGVDVYVCARCDAVVDLLKYRVRSPGETGGCTCNLANEPSAKQHASYCPLALTGKAP